MYDLFNLFSKAFGVSYDSCSTGDIRIAVNSTNITSGSLEGRLEVCINNAWGTVCNERFGSEDAAVACFGVAGFSRQEASVLPGGPAVSGDGPIFLSDLNCDGSERTLLECRRQDNQPLGLQTCDHTSDVSISCTGMG